MYKRQDNNGRRIVPSDNTPSRTGNPRPHRIGPFTREEFEASQRTDGTTFFDPDNTVVPPPVKQGHSRKSLRHITDLINARRGEKGLKAVSDLNSTGMTHHSFGPVRKDDVVGTNMVIEDGKEVKIPAATLMAGNEKDFDGISGDILSLIHI